LSRLRETSRRSAGAGTNEHKQKGRPRGRASCFLQRRDLLAGRFARRLLAVGTLGLEVLAGLLVDNLHREPGLAAIIEAEQLDLDLVAFLDDVGGLLHARRSELADVDQTVLGAEEVHERAELH